MEQAGRRNRRRNGIGGISVLLVALMTLFSLVAPLVAHAQTLRGTEFSTEQGDRTLTWTADWEASLEGDDDFSTMIMLQGEIMIYAVMFVHDPLAGMSMRSVYFSLSDVLVSSFEGEPSQTYEWQGEDGSFRGLNVVKISGINFLLYMRVDPGVGGAGPTMQFAGAPLLAFSSSLSAMQAEIRIDGEPAMDGDNADELLAKLQENEQSEGDSAADASSSRSLTLPTRSGVSSGLMPTAEASGGEFWSEANDYTVTYGEGWVPTKDVIGEFSLVASHRPYTVVSFTGRSTTETNRQAYFEDIVAREGRHSSFIGSVIGEDRLLIASLSGEDELSLLEYVFVDDDTVVTVMVTFSGADPDSSVDAVREIKLDGVPLLQDWDDLP